MPIRLCWCKTVGILRCTRRSHFANISVRHRTHGNNGPDKFKCGCRDESRTHHVWNSLYFDRQREYSRKQIWAKDTGKPIKTPDRRLQTTLLTIRYRARHDRLNSRFGQTGQSKQRRSYNEQPASTSQRHPCVGRNAKEQARKHNIAVAKS